LLISSLQDKSNAYASRNTVLQDLKSTVEDFGNQNAQEKYKNKSQLEDLCSDNLKTLGGLSLGSFQEESTRNPEACPGTCLMDGAQLHLGGEQAGDDFSALKDIISHSMGKVVMYFRQQDLGELWLELLEDELKPPWDAMQTLRVIVRHNTTFWSVIYCNLSSISM